MKTADVRDLGHPGAFFQITSYIKLLYMDQLHGCRQKGYTGSLFLLRSPTVVCSRGTLGNAIDERILIQPAKPPRQPSFFARAG